MELSLSANPFNWVIEARKNQAGWIIQLLLNYDLPIVIMGKRYKPNTNLTDYSAANLVASFLGSKAVFCDPLLGITPKTEGPHVFLIGHMFDFVHQLDRYPSGSVVVDPWRCFSNDEIGALSLQGVMYVPLGVS